MAPTLAGPNTEGIDCLFKLAAARHACDPAGPCKAPCRLRHHTRHLVEPCTEHKWCLLGWRWVENQPRPVPWSRRGVQ